VFREKIRRREPPLNCVLNLLLAWCATGTLERIIGTFRGGSFAGEGLRLVFPPERNFTQADVCLESATSRVFIEAKIFARTSPEQVQKYLLLQAVLDREVSRTPYLFFLTAGDFNKSWPLPEGSSVLTEAISAATSYGQLPAKLRSISSEADYETARSRISYGHATWNDLGDCIACIAAEWSLAGRSNEARVLTDFTAELAARSLWKPKEMSN
jgi:hypothetical protein